MPKTVHIELEVPSRSRAQPLFEWLTKLLEPHRMKVTRLELVEEDGMNHIVALPVESK